MLERYRGSAASSVARAASRPRSTYSRSKMTPSRTTADDDGGGSTAVPHPRRQTSTPHRRLAPIDKRHRNRPTRKRGARRPETTELTPPQHSVVGSAGGGGGPKFRMTSGGRRSRLRPAISRRSRPEIAEAVGAIPFPPSAAKREENPPLNYPDCKLADSHPPILERGTTFTSSVIVSEVSATEGYRVASPFQLHHLPLSSTSGSELDLLSPPSKSSETKTPHFCRPITAAKY